MREKVKDPSRILHIKKALSKIKEFLTDKHLTDLEDESVLFYAVVKNLEIIGEAAYMLTEEFKAAHPEIEWLDYEKLRHVLVHGYYTINPRIVYEICIEDLPKLEERINSLG